MIGFSVAVHAATRSSCPTVVGAVDLRLWKLMHVRVAVAVVVGSAGMAVEVLEGPLEKPLLAGLVDVGSVFPEAGLHLV